MPLAGQDYVPYILLSHGSSYRPSTVRCGTTIATSKVIDIDKVCIRRHLMCAGQGRVMCTSKRVMLFELYHSRDKWG